MNISPVQFIVRKKPKRPPSTLDRWLGRRTRDDFARKINSLEQLSPQIQEALSRYLKDDETIREIIFAPFQSVLNTSKITSNPLKQLLPWEFTPDHILILTENRLLVGAMSQPDSIPEIKSVPLRNILSIKIGIILLHAWFEFTWVHDGRTEHVKVYFNTVCDHLFKQLVNQIRQGWIQHYQLSAAEQTLNKEILESLPYKFKNLIRMDMILPGEQIQRMVYCPSIWKRHLGVLRYHASPRMTFLLTNYHLSLAEEDLSDHDGSYGFYATHIPITHVRKVEVIQKKEGDNQFVITMALNGVEETLSVLCHPDSVQGLKKFL